MIGLSRARSGPNANLDGINRPRAHQIPQAGEKLTAEEAQLGGVGGGVDPHHEFPNESGRPMPVMNQGRPIAELI